MNNKLRRSALLVAASDSVVKDNRPPESTKFEFPLYLNTEPKSWYRVRYGDDISKQLIDYIVHEHESGNSLVLDLYIDGFHASDAFCMYLMPKNGKKIYDITIIFDETANYSDIGEWDYLKTDNDSYTLIIGE